MSLEKESVTLRLDGVDWSYWKSAEVTRQMDAIAGAFSVALADRWTDGAQALPIAAGMECELLIGDEPVIKGYIDKSSPSFSAQAHGLTISGRDKSADLVDCSALHSPGQWLGQNALQLAGILARPFGVSVSAEGDVGAPLPNFKLEQGETAFEALDRVLKQRELLACPDGAGGLVLLKIGARENSIALVQGENILSASADFDLTDRFSVYLAQGQQPGNDEVYGLAACAVHAEARDSAVTRYRPLILRAESNVDSAAAGQRAAWERAVRAARSVTVSVTAQGFRQGPNGPLWRLNALTGVDIPFLRLRQRLMTSKVTFRRDTGSGSVTVLELKDPAAFSPEPKEAATSASSSPIESEKDLQTRFAEDAARRQEEIREGAR
ncbi:MAG: phage tail protein [Deltaproteobacteria bacterium]|jgi:prophage tail gpP-like protein|nr:phage tail protein [Deltaproteobacteria bacterium]